MAIDKNKLREIARRTEGTENASGNSTSNKSNNESSVAIFIIIGVVLLVLFFAWRGKKENVEVAAPDTSQIKKTEKQPKNIGEFVSMVASSNETNIFNLVTVAMLTDDREKIKDLSVLTGRNFDFSRYNIQRHRKNARQLNEEAIALLNENNVNSAYLKFSRAFEYDPLDIEIAGNLAICQYRLGNTKDAYNMVLYALSLPRQPEKTGRTADYVTLAAIFAVNGEIEKANSALLITLAIAPNVARRCRSAIVSVQKNYGDALKLPTENLFRRIRDMGLSNEPECALPINWDGFVG